ncbi:MAG: DEAD/DEAH box helicase [Polyangiales bacterium]
MPKAPWERARGVDAVLRQWRADPSARRSLTLLDPLPARAAEAAELPGDLAPPLAEALRARRVEGLYAHQRRAWDLARAGRNLVVATPTASGKSLCYHLPVAQRLFDEHGARALYLFPTRALARDQEHALSALLRAAGLAAPAATYDGDTAADARRAIRERAAVVITNPDMLHAGVLPHHAAWARFFASLRYVVVDELHAYTGVFGSHVANVLRRLARVARFHGASPTFICASATVGNPEAHARRLLGAPVEAVTRSGAPAGPRHVAVFNPPALNPELGVRPSYLKTAVRVAADLVRADVPTLVFGQSRGAVETMLRYLRERLAPEGVPEEAVVAYRGGYLSHTRRRVEEGLRNGEVRCVVATSALELGVDVGDLDAVVCAGYPGTVAATWQRFGRAGRRGAPSLAVFVPSAAPVDQYLAREPAYLTNAPVEEARIDPDNVEVLLQHLRCAAFELPFAAGEGFGSVGADVTDDALGLLADEGLVHRTATRWQWVAGQYPAQGVSLRAVGGQSVLVVDASRDATLAELDARSAAVQLHVGAVYQHEGDTYLVEAVDDAARKVLVRPSPHDWFTDPLTRVDVAVVEEAERATLHGDGSAPCGRAEVTVTTRLVGWKKVRFHTHENLGYGELDAAPVEMQTGAFWVVLDEAAVESLAATPDDRGAPAGRARVLDGLRGVAYALRTVTSLALMCSPRDLDTTLGGCAEDAAPVRDESVGPGMSPTIFLFDAAPGGVGLAERAFERRDELCARAYGMVLSCPCDDGCPACVAPGVDTGAAGRKQLALEIFRALGTTALT